MMDWLPHREPAGCELLVCLLGCRLLSCLVASLSGASYNAVRVNQLFIYLEEV